MKKKFKYTAEHLEFLRDGYQSMPIRDLVPAFNKVFGLVKTAVQIQSALKSHRITCGRKHSERMMPLRIFTPEQIQFLRAHYMGRNVAELRDIFNKHFGADKTWKQIKFAVHNRNIVCGRTGRFEKGYVSWNKGTKGLTSVNVTSFKKGNNPPNRKPLGSERICSKDGYVLIKVAERNPHTGSPTRYKHKHVHLWEKDNGPVPSGMVVAFKDGNKLNFDPGNRMLISRAELQALNKHGYSKAPDELKPSVLALVKLKVKTFAKARGRL